jgi:hypothetical protein
MARDWRLPLVLGCAALGATGGALSRRYAPQATRRSFIRGDSPFAQVLGGVEGALQGVILAVIILALANLI